MHDSRDFFLHRFYMALVKVVPRSSVFLLSTWHQQQEIKRSCWKALLCILSIFCPSIIPTHVCSCITQCDCWVNICLQRWKQVLVEHCHCQCSTTYIFYALSCRWSGDCINWNLLKRVNPLVFPSEVQEGRAKEAMRHSTVDIKVEMLPPLWANACIQVALRRFFWIWLF